MIGRIVGDRCVASLDVDMNWRIERIDKDWIPERVLLLRLRELTASVEASLPSLSYIPMDPPGYVLGSVAEKMGARAEFLRPDRIPKGVKL